MIRVRAATPEDALALAPRLRIADRAEIAAQTSEEPVDVLLRGVECSKPAHAIVADPGDQVLALFGVTPQELQPGACGAVWLLASDELLGHSMQFRRECRAWVSRLQQTYNLLWCYVDARNAVHRRWVEWCGFKPASGESSLWTTASGHRFLRYQRTL